MHTIQSGTSGVAHAVVTDFLHLATFELKYTLRPDSNQVTGYLLMLGFVVILALTVDWYITLPVALVAIGLIFWKLNSYTVVELYENTILFKRGYAFLLRTLEVKYDEIEKLEVTQLPRGFCRVKFLIRDNTSTYTLMYQHWRPDKALEWLTSKGVAVSH